MRLVFFGTGEFAIPSLRALANHLVLVVTQPDRPSGRGLQLKASPAKHVAEELGLPLSTPEKCSDREFVDYIGSLGADAIVVAAYGQILPESLLSASKQGAFNLHGSILPLYRGAAPIQRALLEGQTETGITLMQMDRGMDTGDVIAIERTSIDPNESYTELQSRLAEMGASLAQAWMPNILQGDYPRVPQDHDKATLAPKVKKDDARLSFDRPATAEYNRFRAVTDSPGAWIRTRFGNLTLRAARWSPLTGTPGTVLTTKPGLNVVFAEGAMEWRTVQPEGKRPMSGLELANGWRLNPGSNLSPEVPPESANRAHDSSL